MIKNLSLKQLTDLVCCIRKLRLNEDFNCNNKIFIAKLVQNISNKFEKGNCPNISDSIETYLFDFFDLRSSMEMFLN